MKAIAEEFLDALGQRSATAAVGTVAAARASGVGVGALVSGVMAPAMREVGARWERDEWSVAQEHAATVIADGALSAITSEPLPTGPRHVVAACPDGEWHALPVRMMVESLREQGWEVTFLGTSLPADQLGRFLADHRPTALLLGITLVGRLPAAGACVTAARRNGVPTVLGGAAALAFPEAAAAVGAHAGTPDLAALDELLGEIAREGPLPAPERTDARRRCARLTDDRVALTAGLLHDLQATGVGRDDSPAHDLLGASIDQYVDALAAAALLDDGRPVVDLIRWFERALRARGLPTDLVAATTSVLDDAARSRLPAGTVTAGSPAPSIGPVPTSSVGLCTVEVDDRTGEALVVGANDALTGLVGPATGPPIGHRIEVVLGDRAWAELRAGLDGGAQQVETVLDTGSGRMRPVRLHWGIGPLGPGPPGRSTHVVAVEAVTGQRELVRSLRRRALHDPLTGLPNRTLFLEHLRQALLDSRRTGQVVAAAYLDVDDLKEVNESLGHEAGDELLVTVAQRLRRTLRVSDLAGRLGGDEFAVVCPGLTSEHEVARIGERIQSTVSGPCLIGGHEVGLSVSIGLATARGADSGESSAALLNRADEALRRAKREGKNTSVLFDAVLDREVRRRNTVAAELRQAVRLEQLRLRYQPVVDLTDRHVVGAEALLRWQHPDRGLLAPAAFLQIAEESGSILDLGRWVLDEACTELSTWRAAGDEPIVISVNVSARQLGRGEVVSLMEDHLASQSPDPRRRLRMEVTETALTDSAAARQELWDLDALGVEVGIDDFGTGYASLTYLQQLPVRFLKIDRSFVAEMMHDHVHRSIVSAVTALAGALGITVIAEGVETVAQEQALLDLGCTVGQGYLYGRPDTVDRLRTLAADDPTAARP